MEFRKYIGNIKPTGYESSAAYLLAIYKQLKDKIKPSYSWVKFTQDLGLGKGNVAYLIAHGKSKLTGKSAQKVAESLQLFSTERKYFLNLVEIENEKDLTKKEKKLKELISIKSRSLPQTINKKHLNFFAEWYHGAILEILRWEDSSDDIKWLSTALRPNISPTKVSESLKLLKEKQKNVYYIYKYYQISK